MPEYENNGIIFRNKKKTDPKHADYTGEALVGGVWYFMDSWIKEGKPKQDGTVRKFMVFRFSRKGRQESMFEHRNRQQEDHAEAH